MDDAAEELDKIVDAANQDYLQKKGARLELKKELFKSWVILLGYTLNIDLRIDSIYFARE